MTRPGFAAGVARVDTLIDPSWHDDPRLRRMLARLDDQGIPPNAVADLLGNVLARRASFEANQREGVDLRARGAAARAPAELGRV